MTVDVQEKHIVIEGMKHCGKSTHGRALAQHLGWPFFDTDELIIEGFSRQLDKQLSIRDIFIMLGEEKFEAFEEQIVKGLYAKLKNTSTRCVIALGGRPPTNPKLHPYLKALGKIVFIRVPTDLLYKRSTRRGPVPFLDPERPRDHFDEICEQRQDMYEKIADITIELGDSTVMDAQQMVINTVKNKLNSWLES